MMAWPRPTLLRPLLGISNAMLCCSALVVLAVFANVIDSVRRSQEDQAGSLAWYVSAKAALTAVLGIIGLWLGIHKTYRGYMLPINLALSYLWLASAIFTWAVRVYVCGEYTTSCSRFWAIEFFSWMTFAIAVLNVLLDILAYRAHLIQRSPVALQPVATIPGPHEKHLPATPLASTAVHPVRSPLSPNVAV